MEYPKMIYRDGNISASQSDYMIVEDEAAEINAKESGFFAHQEQSPDDASELTREQLEAQAKELGIAVDKRWGDKRLAEEIAKTK